MGLKNKLIKTPIFISFLTLSILFYAWSIDVHGTALDRENAIYTKEKLGQLWYSASYFNTKEVIPQIELALSSENLTQISSLSFHLQLSLVRALIKDNQLEIVSGKLDGLKAWENYPSDHALQKIKLMEVLYKEKENSKFDSASSFRKILDAIEQPSTEINAIASFLLGDALYENSQFSLAKPHFDQALLLYNSLESKSDQATIQLQLAHIASANGEYEIADKLTSSAEILAESVSSHELLAVVWLQRAASLRRQGKIQEAFDKANSAISRFQPKNPTTMAKLTYLLGLTTWGLGKTDRVKGYFEQSLAYAKVAKSYALEFSAKLVIAEVLRLTEKIPESLALQFELLQEAEERENYRNMVGILGNVSVTYKGLKQLDKAHEFALRGYRLGKEHEANFISLFRCMVTLGDYYLGNKQFDEAEKYFKESIALAKQHKSIRATTTSLLQMGLLYEEKNDLENALFYYLEATKNIDKLESLPTKMHALLSLARLQALNNRFSDANRNALRAYEKVRESGNKHLVKASLQKVVDVLTITKDWENGFKYLSELNKLIETNYSNENKEAIAKLTTEYERTARQHEIEMLTKETELKSATIAQQKSQTLVIIILAFALVAIGTLSILRYFGRRETEQIRKHAAVVRKNAEEISLLTEAFKNASDAMWIASKDLKVLEVNDAHTQLTGFSREMMLTFEVLMEDGGIIYQHATDSSKALKQDQSSPLHKESNWQAELSIRIANGNCLPIDFSFEPIRDENNRITHYLGIFRDITERKRFQDELQHLATHDGLTGIANRTLFLELLDKACKTTQAKGKRPAVLFIDLDNFKQINDTLGHDEGDSILIAVSRLIEENIQKNYTLARIGGDEFCLLIEDENPQDKSAFIARKLLDLLAEPFNTTSGKHFLSASIGIALFPLDGSNAKELMRNADIAMYDVKKSAKNDFKFFKSEMNERIIEDLKMEKRIREAIESDIFQLFYQPKVDIKTKQIIGGEALIRWIEEDGTVIFPDQFIPLSERVGLIEEIDCLVIKQACRQIGKWRKEGLAPGIISINLSAGQFNSPDTLIPLLLETVQENGISAADLELEITESMLLDDLEEAINTMHILRRHGFSIAVDDFGTGYSSLSYIQRLPIDVLKIDRGFVAKIGDSKRDLGVVSAIINMAHHLDLTVVAEGVEDLTQLKLLKKLSCEAYQGYYFSKPIPKQDYQVLLGENQKSCKI